MPLKDYIDGLENYRGFCVAAIAESNQHSVDKTNQIQKIPATVSYDEYVGVASIVESDQDSDYKTIQIGAMFNT